MRCSACSAIEPGTKPWLSCRAQNGRRACALCGAPHNNHARRKFHELWANHSSTLAEQALKLIGTLYDIEREIKDLASDERLHIRQLKARPAADLLHAWLMAHRQKVPDGAATAKAIDYSLKRWAALTRFIDDGDLSIDSRQPSSGSEGSGDHELAAHGQTQRVRPLPVPQGRAGAIADSAGQPHQRAAAVLLEAWQHRLTGRQRRVKMTLPDAYAVFNQEGIECHFAHS
ncbi:transposase [Variovorax paradoxus]|nr:transposase [Variovorax paradoxus]